MPESKKFCRKRLRLWRVILKAEPDVQVVPLIVASLPDDLALCQALPRHGFWFNKTRQLMGLDPKDLRKILVNGREAAIKEQKDTAQRYVKKAPISNDKARIPASGH